MSDRDCGGLLQTRKGAPKMPAMLPCPATHLARPPKRDSLRGAE
jgi:hypothetical protein